MHEILLEDLSSQYQYLLHEAAQAMENAYNPYSHFFVGAALLGLHEKRVVTGSNVENASYSLTICAERSALVRANDQGIRSFEAIAIIARGQDFETTQVTGPCGACRQMLYEVRLVADHDLAVVMSTTRQNKIVVATIDELLPLAFGPQDLGIDVGRYR